MALPRRLNKYKSRYAEAEARYGPKPNVWEAVEAYVQLAQEHGLTPVQLAIRCVPRDQIGTLHVLG